MKHKILAIALVSALPLVAQAQTSVTMYGMVDASIGVENNDAPGESSRTVVSSGTQSASRIGCRGTEDLGTGLKALFNIEAAVAVDTGATDSNMFQRRAVVGLQGAFGTVTVGREYGPIAAVAGASDTLGQGFYGSNLAAFGANRLTRRLSNSVNYQSNALSGFTLRAAYGAGERSIERHSGSGGGSCSRLWERTAAATAPNAAAHHRAAEGLRASQRPRPAAPSPSHPPCHPRSPEGAPRARQ